MQGEESMADCKFTWGGLVRVTHDAPAAFRPGATGSVCSVEELVRPERALFFGLEVGAVVYLVEFADGVSIEIAEAFLEEVEDS